MRMRKMNARDTINNGIGAKILRRFLTVSILDANETLGRLSAIIVRFSFCLYCIRRCFTIILCMLEI